MDTSDINLVPVPQESLSDYVRRVRIGRRLSQQDVATRAGVHLQTVGKLERGLTTKLNRKAQGGFAYALQIPLEYLQALSKGESIAPLPTIKFCSQCWVPGTQPERHWTDARARYCFLCGTTLCSRCRHCQEPIGSLQHRFCPYCGTPYKSGKV